MYDNQSVAKNKDVLWQTRSRKAS